MCGFVGVLQARDRGPVDEATLRALLRWIRHRGPDQEGVFVKGGFGLAAARLAVRGGPEGDQPLVSEDGNVVVAFNGHLFRVAPALADTPAVITAHRAPSIAEAGDWRDAAAQGVFEILRGGMGAVVIYDARERTVRLWRDALAIKPLFEVEDADDATWFASTITVLLHAAPQSRTLEPAGLSELLHLGRPIGHTPFRGIKWDRFGTTLSMCELDADGYADRGFTFFESENEFDRSSEPPPADPVAALRETWAASARHAAAVDGPVSLFLSGGLDSAAVAAWCGRDDVLCLTGRFAPHGGVLDESDLAADVARQAGLQHEVVDLKDEDLLLDLPDVIAALEIPMMGPGSLALWRMAKRAREHGKVVLTGTGGDELFGGYTRSALVLGRAGPWTRGYEPLRARIEAAGDDPSARLRAAFSRFQDLERFLDADFLRSLPAPAAPHDLPGLLWEQDELHRAVMREERGGTLPALLHVEDRVTMAHGLEGRPVGCLGGLLDLSRRMPQRWLIGPDGEGKVVLREALRGHVPERVRVNPVKRGFPTPFARAARGAGREIAMDCLHDQRFVERGWWNVEACRALLDADRPLHDRALWTVLSWETWARLFLDGDLFEGPLFTDTPHSPDPQGQPDTSP